MKLLLLLGVVAPLEVFQQAEKLYNEGRFGEAIALYEALRAEGAVDGALHYNLGNAHFKSGRLGLAILNYERALRLMPGDEDTEANLSFARELIADAVEEPRLPGYLAWAVRLYKGLEPDTCAALLSFSFPIGGAAASILLMGRWPRLRLPSIYLLLVVGFLALGSGAVLAAKVGSKPVEAIALSPRSEVRSGPGEANPSLAEIHEGLKLSVRGEREGWLQVSLPNGLTGWVLKADVETI